MLPHVLEILGLDSESHRRRLDSLQPSIILEQPSHVRVVHPNQLINTLQREWLEKAVHGVHESPLWRALGLGQFPVILGEDWIIVIEYVRNLEAHMRQPPQSNGPVRGNRDEQQVDMALPTYAAQSTPMRP